MLKRLLFLLLLPVSLFSMSKGPDNDTYEDPTIYLNTYVNDYKNKTVYYESTPIISQDSNNNLLSLIPILVQNTVTGEVQMQIFFSYYPHNSNSTLPKNMYISSHKRQITLPVLSPKKIIETNIFTTDSNAIMSEDSSEVSLGSVYVFVNDAKKIIDLIQDTKAEAHYTTMIATTVPARNVSNVQFIPRKYSLSDLRERHQKNTSKGKVLEHTAKRTSLMEMPFDNRYSLVLYFDDTESLTLSPYYTTLLFNFMSFYVQLATKNN